MIHRTLFTLPVILEMCIQVEGPPAAVPECLGEQRLLTTVLDTQPLLP